jgi:hypothetical protein
MLWQGRILQILSDRPNNDNGLQPIKLRIISQLGTLLTNKEAYNEMLKMYTQLSFADSKTLLINVKLDVLLFESARIFSEFSGSLELLTRHLQDGPIQVAIGGASPSRGFGA